MIPKSLTPVNIELLFVILNNKISFKNEYSHNLFLDSGYLLDFFFKMIPKVESWIMGFSSEV